MNAVIRMFIPYAEEHSDHLQYRFLSWMIKDNKRLRYRS